MSYAENFRQVFEDDYKGFSYFVGKILKPIFGDDCPTEFMPQDLLVDSKFKIQAERANIKKAMYIGQIPNIYSNAINLYDITIKDNCRISQSRVGIQNMVRSDMMQFSYALIIFHYETTENRSWRFSFAAKEENLSKTTNTKRFTYLFGKNIACHTAAQRFEILRNSKKKDEDVLNAFSVEALSDEFFDKYLGYYASFVKFITGKPTPKEAGEHKITKPEFVNVVKAMDALGKRDELNQFERVFGNKEKEASDYIKKMMGRITFLHFLQKKGWLCDDLNYMHTLFDKHNQDQDDFLERILEPLFFGVLNTGVYDDTHKKSPEEISEETYNYRKVFWEKHNKDAQTNHNLTEWNISLLDDWKTVPYLNGGLFEDDTLDRMRVRFPAEMFKQLFDFFEEYNFTIDENDPNDAEIGVDPEMLGKIFENLLEDNKDKGAYYTPKEIVKYMCRESLKAYLQADITDETIKGKISRFVETYDVSEIDGEQSDLAQSLDKKLIDVKICDPAIGSGAFPMGLLKELFFCRGAIEHFDNSANIKRHIIQNNIYGVDIERGAVDIARLRFWLSLIIDEKAPETLPNLDFKIMQGNSLLERYEDTDLTTFVPTTRNIKKTEPQKNLFGQIDDEERQLNITFTEPEMASALSVNIEKYFSEDNHNKRSSLFNAIEENVKKQILYNLKEHMYSPQTTIEQVSTITSPKPSQVKGLINAKKELEHLKELMEEINNMSMVNDKFFLWHIWFNDVFNRPSKQGFDIVIGNPPFVEAKKLKYIASTLKEPYKKIYSGTADLSIYFIELGRNLMNDNGCMYFIVTNKFFNTRYGKNVRKMLCKNTLMSIINFEQVEVFEDILVSSVILGFNKKTPSTGSKFTYEHFYKLKTKEFKAAFIAKQGHFGTYPQQYLSADEWSFTDASGRALKQHIEIGSIALSKVEGVKINRGVTTGYNPAFIVDNSQTAELIKLDPHNSSIIKNMLQGRNIRKWYYNESNENLIFTRRGIPINDFPFIKKYLHQFFINLQPKETSESHFGRKPGNYNWYEILDNTAYFQEFEVTEKIIWGLTADKWAFAYDDKKHYLPSNGYILTSTTIPVKYILALLNSKLFQYYFSHIGVVTAGGAFTLKASTISLMPFKKATNMESYELLVNEILNKKEQNKQCDVSAEEIAIDLLVYHLYNLTYDEVLIIDPKIPVTRKEYVE